MPQRSVGIEDYFPGITRKLDLSSDFRERQEIVLGYLSAVIRAIRETIYPLNREQKRRLFFLERTRDYIRDKFEDYQYENDLLF